MTKRILASVLLTVLVGGAALAGDMACCASKTGKTECAKIYAKLDLTPDQKAKLDSFQETCMKEGCTDGSMQKFLASAKDVLSTGQYDQLKAECSKMEKKPKAARG